jgi:hypothetical protein
MYHEDRLGGGGFAGAWISGAGRQADEARAQLEGRLRVPVRPVDVRGLADLRTAAQTSLEQLDMLAAPVGILLRSQAA